MRIYLHYIIRTNKEMNYTNTNYTSEMIEALKRHEVNLFAAYLHSTNKSEKLEFLENIKEVQVKLGRR